LPGEHRRIDIDEDEAMKLRSIAATLLIAALPGPALAQDAAKEMEAAMQTMMKDMHMKSTGDADKDFVIMMIPHHQGAIDMAKVQLKYGKDPAIRKLAEAVIAAQEKEIAEMKAWQAANP
jgi:uncharacterized protein (DUF305 family)